MPKISELTNITGANLADADEFVVVDTDVLTTKAVTRAEFFKNTPKIGVGFLSPAYDLEVQSDAAYIRVSDINGSLQGSMSAGIRFGAGSDSYSDHGQVGFLATASGIMLCRNMEGDLILEADNRNLHTGSAIFLRVDNTTRATINSTGLTVNGALSKSSGSFKIDHPLKPDTHHLVHSFIEGPQADNLYRGRVNLVDGSVQVNIDTASGMTEGTFVALNGNVQCFLTNEDGWTAVRGSVTGNILTIEAQDPTCTDTVSWMVVGERHDQHMLETPWTDETGRVIVEPLKPEEPVEQ